MDGFTVPVQLIPLHAVINTFWMITTALCAVSPTMLLPLAVQQALHCPAFQATTSTETTALLAAVCNHIG